MGAIVFYYRWWTSIPILLCPLLLAAAYAFALASLPPFRVTSLNSNTAFLGSIIIGNGINVGLILLARYREERMRGATVENALVTGVWGARVGTLVAAAAASASYGSLAFTEFRGFRQFGFIGGIGMLMSWLTAFLLIPPLVRRLDREDPGPVRAAPIGRSPMDAVARFASQTAPWIVGATAVLAAASAIEASRFDRSRLEHDLSKLRRVDTWESGEGLWGRKMDALLGHYLTPTMLLFDTTEQARTAEASLRDSVDKGPLHPMVARVVSADDVLPVNQGAKLEELRRIRRVLTPRIRSLVPPEKLVGIDRLTFGGADLVPISAA
jgi:predicted exporter